MNGSSYVIVCWNVYLLQLDGIFAEHFRHDLIVATPERLFRHAHVINIPYSFLRLLRFCLFFRSFLLLHRCLRHRPREQQRHRRPETHNNKKPKANERQIFLRNHTSAFLFMHYKYFIRNNMKSDQSLSIIIVQPPPRARQSSFLQIELLFDIHISSTFLLFFVIMNTKERM